MKEKKKRGDGERIKKIERGEQRKIKKKKDFLFIHIIIQPFHHSISEYNKIKYDFK